MFSYYKKNFMVQRYKNYFKKIRKIKDKKINEIRSELHFLICSLG